MLVQFTGFCVFLGILSLTAAYDISVNIVNDLPEFLNISTAPFVKIGSNYYFIDSKQVNWYTAYESCRRMNADLVAFENLEELNLVANHITDKYTTKIKTYWTSGTDLAEQDVHVWFSNGQTVQSDLWRKGEPNNLYNNEHCDELNLVGIGLNDRICNFTSRYICKASQPKTASFIVW